MTVMSNGDTIEASTVGREGASWISASVGAPSQARLFWRSRSEPEQRHIGTYPLVASGLALTSGPM
jgi:hypothetical protein